MKPISNIAYWIQYLTISFILDLQENIYIQVPKTHYMCGGEARREVVGFLDLFIDVLLEVLLGVQNKRYSQILYLIDYVVPGLHF